MYHVITHILQALMQAAEPDDPQDAVVAQQVNCFYMEGQLLCPWMPECQMQVKMLTLMTQRRAEASKALLKIFSLYFKICWLLRYYRGVVCLIGNMPQLFECKKPVRAK